MASNLELLSLFPSTQNSFLLDLYAQIWTDAKDILRNKCRQTAGKKNPETQAHLYIKGRRGENTYTIACIIMKNFWKNFKVNTFISEKCDQSVLDRIDWELLLLFTTFYKIFIFHHDPIPCTTPWKDLRSKTFLPWPSPYIEDPGGGGNLLAPLKITA